MSTLQQAMIDFTSEFEYNGMLYYQQVIDVLRKTDHIVDVSSNIKVLVQSYNVTDKKYDEPVELVSRMRLRSGYIRVLDTNSAITINSANINMVASSQMDTYNSENEEIEEQ